MANWVFAKGTQAIQKRKVSLNKYFWKTEHSYAKKINFNLHLLPYTKINPKYITHLNVKL